MLNNPAFALTLLFIILVTLTAALRLQYRQAGKRLLILSQFNFWQFILIRLGIAILIWGIYKQNATIIYGSAIFLNFYLQLFCPTEFCEQGIIISGSFIRWRRIQSYQWEQSSKYTILKLKSKNWHRKWRIRVSPEKRSRIEHILKEKSIYKS